MMHLTIDIEQMAKPVLNNAGESSHASRRQRFTPVDSLKSFCSQLDIFILSLEGSLNHLDQLSLEDAKELLSSTKKTVGDLDKVDEELRSSSYFQHQELKEKFSYMLKLMFKIESRLHRIVFRDSPRIKTSLSLKEGITKMNALHIKNLLSD
ncbi:hypothetical protein HC174_15025 [Salinimicrobium sp. CDJ15-81-2]|nr:hypothetical protein [Salinimicrobium nanhaiense]